MRALAEGDLDRASRIQILLAGLPKLRSELQERPSLWRAAWLRPPPPPEPLGYGVEQEFDTASDEHRANVAVEVLSPRPGPRLDLSRETVGAAAEEAAGGLVPVEDQGDEAMGWSGEGLVSLEAGVLLDEEVAEVLGLEECLDASQGVRTGDLVASPEDLLLHPTMPLELL